MKKTTNKKPEKKQKQVYSLDLKAKAKKYYLMGLSLNEVSKLVSAPVRTIEKWQIAEKWKSLRENKTIHFTALELFNSGKTYKEIATLLQVSTATIWRYLKQAKNE